MDCLGWQVQEQAVSERCLNTLALIRQCLVQDEGSAGTTAQNVLAIALALLLVAAVGNVIFKIVVVSWALFSAAVRYSAVALILICLGTLIA